MVRRAAALLGGLSVLGAGLFFTVQDYRALLLGDQDYTNISRAIAHSEAGLGLDGLLPAPHVSTGSTKSFLGHHFAPALLLLKIGYALPGAGHFVYGIFLLMALSIGVFLILLDGKSLPAWAFLFLWVSVVFSPALWQMMRSYHFEALALPLTIGTFQLARRAGKPARALWPVLVIWLMVKEDMVFPVFLMGLYLLLLGISAGRILLALSIAYGFLATGALALLHEDSIRLSYFQNLWGKVDPLSWTWILPPFLLIFFSRWWPLFLPVFLMLSLSRHPWLAALEGHYVYTVLPLFLLAQLEGLRRIVLLDRWKVTIILAICILGSIHGWLKKPHLFARAAGHPDRQILIETINQKIKILPRGSCIQAAVPYSAHVPLDYPVFPLVAPRGSPFHDSRPPYLAQSHLSGCRSMHLLFDSKDPRPPYYTREHLEALKGYYAGTGRLIDLSGKRVAADSLEKTM
ncbi:MAG: DUF2079 domain-containing protein [Spirochaetales bacterium]|nr:DUF2079 domain-containing protein [Spirochaetales bacterium]